MSYFVYNLEKLSKKKDAILCLDCGWLATSHNRHDYKTCRCPNAAMIDGGYDYTRYGAAKMDRIQLFVLKPYKEQTDGPKKKARAIPKKPNKSNRRAKAGSTKA